MGNADTLAYLVTAVHNTQAFCFELAWSVNCSIQVRRFCVVMLPVALKTSIVHCRHWTQVTLPVLLAIIP